MCIAALAAIPAEKNSLKILIAVLTVIVGIAYVIGFYTEHFGKISKETINNSLPLFAALLGYAGTPMISVQYFPFPKLPPFRTSMKLNIV